MNAKRVLLLVGVGLLVLAGVWYFGKWRRVELYGGVKPFMERMQKLHAASAAELEKNAPQLPQDFVWMERLAQSAQDVFAVFAKDERFKNGRFAPNATELVRRATQFEQAWDNGKAADARDAFRRLTAACTACHADLAVERPPGLETP
jgi:cytochrome c556